MSKIGNEDRRIEGNERLSLRGTFVGAIFIALFALLPSTTVATTSSGIISATLDQSRDALGTVALERGGTILLDTTATVSGLPGSGRSAAEIGGARLAERTTTPPIALGDGYDGRVFWNQDQTGLVWVDGSAAGVSQEIDDAYAAGDTLFVRGSGGARIAWSGVRKEGAGRYDVLTVTPRGSRIPMEAWIDSATHLPARYVVRIAPVEYETDLSSYRLVDGLMLPHRIASRSSDGNSSEERVTSARLVSIDNTAFVKPESHVSDFSIDGGVKSTSVPIGVIDNHVYLNVTLNGRGPYRFVFDTGGSNIVDPAVAKELGLAGSGSTNDTGTGASTESSSYATLDSLRIGGAVLKKQVFFVEPVRKGFGATAGERVDGLIGFEVLARYVTTFDYANRTLTLAMPVASVPAGANVVPFVLLGTNPQIACAVDGIPSQCTVDTGDGSSVNLYVPFIADHQQIVPEKHSAIGINGTGVGGGHRGFMGRLASLQVGNFTLRDLVAGYSTQNEGFFASPFLAANLGGGVWRRFTVTFDYQSETMALQPNASLGETDSFDRSGMHLINKAGRVVVYDVRQGTPAAAAGFVKGDVIVSVDGVPAQSMEQVKLAFRRSSGTVLHVAITDTSGVPRTILLTLRDWV